ncbi:MAG: hypothetical protein Q7S27_04980 [Nanoarchaeota archaeon]|nr:hypothetical protein [Nanoarchaeota archaeon]
MDYREELNRADEEIKDSYEWDVISKYTCIIDKVYRQTAKILKIAEVERVTLKRGDYFFTSEGELYHQHVSRRGSIGTISFIHSADNLSETSIMSFAPRLLKSSSEGYQNLSNGEISQRVLREFIDDLVISSYEAVGQKLELKQLDMVKDR